jgi:Protein of unknown function, DUF547
MNARTLKCRLYLALLPLCFIGCIKEAIIKRKNAQAIETVTPLVSKAPLPTTYTTPEKFPYEIWERVLREFVDERGMVDYQRLKDNRADLDLFVAHLNRYSPKTHPALFPTSSDRLAYYLNAFNSSTFLLVLSRHPLKNIYDMRTEFFVGTVFVLGGEKYTLNSLETMLREEFSEPRVHFVLNCAARGDPRLFQETITSQNTEAFLEKSTRYYLSEPRHVRIVDEKTVELSSMFDLYGDDFLAFLEKTGESKPNLLKYINRYREEKLPENARIKFAPYNWVPNDQAIP